MIFFAGTSVAQMEEKSFTLYAAGGIAFSPQPHDYHHLWKTGYDLHTAIGYSFSTVVAIVGSFDYNNYPLDENGYRESNTLGNTPLDFDQYSASISSVLVNLKVSLIHVSHISPYFVAGLGAAWISNYTVQGTVSLTGNGLEWTEGPTLLKTTKSEYPILLGAGIDVQLGESLGFFIGVTDMMSVYVYGGGSTSYVVLKAGPILKF